MGLFDGLLGNASEVSISDVRAKYQQLLAPGLSGICIFSPIRGLYW